MIWIPKKYLKSNLLNHPKFNPAYKIALKYNFLLTGGFFRDTIFAWMNLSWFRDKKENGITHTKALCTTPKCFMSKKALAMSR